MLHLKYVESYLICNAVKILCTQSRFILVEGQEWPSKGQGSFTGKGPRWSEEFMGFNYYEFTGTYTLPSARRLPSGAGRNLAWDEIWPLPEGIE